MYSNQAHGLARHGSAVQRCATKAALLRSACHIDHSTFEAIGKGTAIDSLAAIKHLIYDTKKLTWDQLLTAIEDDWKGHEAIRQLCLNAPKYGNGIEWVDSIGFDIETLLLEFLHQHPKPHNQAFLLRQIPVAFHVPMGKVTWATPNGRKANEYLSEGISASHGMDTKAPWASMSAKVPPFEEDVWELYSDMGVWAYVRLDFSALYSPTRSLGR